jgi:hypothetical protein
MVELRDWGWALDVLAREIVVRLETDPVELCASEGRYEPAYEDASALGPGRADAELSGCVSVLACDELDASPATGSIVACSEYCGGS